jgi:hypothetical protein
MAPVPCPPVVDDPFSCCCAAVLLCCSAALLLCCSAAVLLCHPSSWAYKKVSTPILAKMDLIGCSSPYMSKWQFIFLTKNLQRKCCISNAPKIISWVH